MKKTQEKIYCAVCDREIASSQWKRHIKSKAHKENVKAAEATEDVQYVAGLLHKQPELRIVASKKQLRKLKNDLKTATKAVKKEEKAVRKLEGQQDAAWSRYTLALADFWRAKETPPREDDEEAIRELQKAEQRAADAKIEVGKKKEELERAKADLLALRETVEYLQGVVRQAKEEVAS